MAFVLGLSAAVAWGAADFLGGVASRRAHAASVVLVSQWWGALAAAGLVAVWGSGTLTVADSVPSAGAGLVGAVGLVLLYRGLAVGRMGLVAPLSSVLAGLLPVAWGLGSGERPSSTALAGVALAIVAVALVTREPADPAAPTRVLTPVLYGLGAGVGFGFVGILFSQTDPSSGAWPLLVARLASSTAVGGLLVATRRYAAPGASQRATVAGAGLLDLAANASYLVGLREGLLSLVGPLASLYPATTVILARGVLHERMTRQQSVGLLAAVTALVLIGAG